MTAENELFALARRGSQTMTGEILYRRIGVALHEAAHFLVAVREGADVFSVDVLSTAGRGPESGVSGRVRIWQAKTQLAEARFYLAGVAHDALLTRCGVARIGDALFAARELVGHTVREGLTRQQWVALAPAVLAEVTDFLSARWPLIVDIAAGFLTAQGARGSRIPGQAVGALYAKARSRLHETSDSPYGGAIGDFLPQTETAAHVQREVERALQLASTQDLERALDRHFAGRGQ